MNCPLLIVGLRPRIVTLIRALSLASCGGHYAMAFTFSLVWIPMES
jgi:hypothetical protein